MAGPGFTQLFGGNTVYPAEPTFLSLNPLAASIVLQWPFEQQSATPTVADIIEVNATAPALTIQLSDARQISTGYCALFNNIGANTFTVLDASGGVLAAIPSGTVWELYLADNSTLAGTWRTFQFGAGVSTANAAALAGAGLVAITTTLNQDYVTSVQNANYNSVVGDRAKVIEWTGGTGSISLPVNATLTAGWFVAIKNLGTGIATVTPNSGTIDGVTQLNFAPDESSFVIYDGANFYTLGFGQTVNSIFDFLQISLAAAAGTVILSGAQLNRVSYKFVGALGGNVVIQVPATIQQYWVDNSTTGAFSLTLSTGGGGTTTAVAQGSRNILYSDGLNVVPAVTFGATGFTDGSVAAPSIFFTSSPGAGVYRPALNQLGLVTSSTQRMLLDATGHVTVNSPDTAGNAVTINGPVPSGTALLVQQQLQNSSNPCLALQSNGLTLMSLSGAGTAGVNDLSIFQLATFEATLMNRANQNLNLGTNSTNRVVINAGGGINIQPPTSGVTLFMSGIGAGNPVMGINNAASTGATGPVLTANKPGASTAIANWIPVNVGGVLNWMPAWAN